MPWGYVQSQKLRKPIIGGECNDQSEPTVGPRNNFSAKYESTIWKAMKTHGRDPNPPISKRLFF